jgi:hypothetical protein
MPEESFQVEVAYVGPEGQWLVSLTVPAGTTAERAVALSGLPETLPGRAVPLRLGIFSKPVAGDHVLRAGDRVEIYRTLQVDPKEARRARAPKRR